MSVWTTKSFNRSNDYIVIKHKLRGVNYIINGVKFRDSYAVVEKDSKTYFNLKKMPVLRDVEEYPLIYLRKLKFITRASDVKTVYGHDVYRKYIEVLEKEIDKEKLVEKQVEQELHLADETRCKFKYDNTGDLCQYNALSKSPSGYCQLHILKEPKLEEMGFTIPKIMTKAERKELRLKIADKLRG